MRKRYADNSFNWQNDKDVVFMQMLHNLYTVMRKEINPQKNDMLLDVGCGRGNFVPYSNDSSYHGIDISNNNIEHCKRNHKEKNFEVMDCCDMNYEDNVFDKVICSEVLEHMNYEEIHRTLFELSRVVKSGGKIIITVPNLYYLWGILPWSFKPIKRRLKIRDLIKGIKNGCAYEEYTHPHMRFKPSYWKKILQEYFVVEGYTTSFWFNNRAIHEFTPNMQRLIHNFSWKGNHMFGNNIIAVLKNNKGASA